jgi:hypothetical protein
LIYKGPKENEIRLEAGTQSLTSSGVKGSRGCLNLVGFAVTAVWTVVAVTDSAVGAIV